MKKTVLAIIFILNILVYGNTYAEGEAAVEIAEATKVLQAYCDAHAAGDIKNIMALMTRTYRAEYKELLANMDAVNPYYKELMILTLQNSVYSIKNVEQHGDEIRAVMAALEPDINLFIDEEAAKVEKGPRDSEEAAMAFFKAVFDAVVPRVKTKEKLVTTEYVLILIKENGTWKIDDDI